MAITLSQKQFSINIGNIINSSINAVQKVRQTEQSRKEAEFQRAIADGMPYEDQIAFRQKQLDEEKGSPFVDDTYITSLEKSITDTKSLQRFNNYRIKYARTVGDLSAGKINEEKYLSTLQSSLVGIDDPDLRLEIQKDIAAAQSQVKTYNDTLVSNSVKKAQYDNTEKSLNDAISRVKKAKTEALVAGKEDDAGTFDQTLAALGSQLSTVKIQDSLTNFQVNSATKGVNPLERLDFINSQAKNADPTTPIKIGDRTYKSAQEYWQQERDSFLAGTSQIFGNFFQEVGQTLQDSVDSNTAKFGYPTQAVLDSTMKVFDDLRAKPEVAPYISKLDVTQAAIISNAVDKTASKIIDIGTNNMTFKDADAQLQNLSKKYNVDTTQYSLKLQDEIGRQAYTLYSQGKMSAQEASALVGDVNAPMPKIEMAQQADTQKQEATTPVGYTIKTGDTLSAIAKSNGITLNQLLTENPELQKNPNMISVGQSIKLPGATQQDVATKPEQPVTPAPTEKSPKINNTQTAAAQPQEQQQAPAPALNQPKTTQQLGSEKAAVKAASTPAVPTPQPVAAQPVAPQNQPQQNTSYTGTSIVDYLKQSGQDTSFSSRLKLASEKGIKNYSGSAEQNTQLLKLLKG